MPPKRLYGNFKSAHSTFAARHRAARQQLPDDDGDGVIEGDAASENASSSSDGENHREKRLRAADSDDDFGGFELGGDDFSELEDENEDIEAVVSS
jgi:hypothetical protein